MTKTFVFLSFLLSASLTSEAQRKIQQLDDEEAKKNEQMKAYEKKGFSKEKLTYGGNAGLSFTNGFTFLMVQPLIGYRVRPKTIPGTGITYIYLGYKGNGVDYSMNAFGPILFLRQELIGQVFAYGEWQPINYERRTSFSKPPERVWDNQLFLGGGLSSGGAQVYILYNVLFDETNSFFNQSPWYIRIGFFL